MSRLTIILVCLLGCGVRDGLAQPATSEAGVERALRTAIGGAGGPSAVSVDAAGISQSGRRLWAVEPLSPEDMARPKLVLVGGIDGDPASAALVVSLVEWWYGDSAAAPLRQQWQLAALPCARPDWCDGAARAPSSAEPLLFPPTGTFFDGTLDPTPQHIWRWTTMQAPTVVVDLRVGSPLRWEGNASALSLATNGRQASATSFVGALGAGGTGPAWSAVVPAVQLTVRGQAARGAIADLIQAAAGVVSPQRTALRGRTGQAPMDIARQLALKYPSQPVMSYIPALSWSGALRLAELTGDNRLREKSLAGMAPWLSGATPAIAEPYLLTSLAGHLALADLGALQGNAAATALARQAADFILPRSLANGEPGSKTEPIVRFARAWTDDMFMATSVLARVAAPGGDDRYAAVAGRLLTTYATELQRPDGLFVHAKEGPHAWGRGNGFAAFGLMEALTHLPAAWAARPRVLQSYQALMKGLVPQQAPDGMWRQVVDEPGSYREFTVTAMVVTAMARGVRLGWLDAAYRPVVDRAWRALLARIAEDGTLMDVCTGTGSGPTRDYYLNRAGVTGADDRGGAMGLTAAIEMHELMRR